MPAVAGIFFAVNGVATVNLRFGKSSLKYSTLQVSDPEMNSHRHHANFIYTSFKFNACMLIAAWHCACNGAAPASLLRYGFAIAAIPALPEPNRLRRLMQARVL